MNEYIVDSNHEKTIKNYLGVSDIGELTEGHWLDWGDKIKFNAPIFMKPENFEYLKDIVTWIEKNLKCDNPSVELLFYLSEIAESLRFSLKIEPWQLLGLEKRRDKVVEILKTINLLEHQLQDNELPALPQATYFLKQSGNLWHDREVNRVIYRFCRNNNVLPPDEIGLGDLFSALKDHLNSLVKPNNYTNRPNAKYSELRVVSRKLAVTLKYRFKLNTSPNSLIATLLSMAYPEYDIDVEKVQNFTKNLI